MKGLLIKDYLILLGQKNSFFIILIGLILLFVKDTPVMGISYTMYVITFLSLSNISYDDADNGMPFLMTLPSGRKTYVTEKYLFNLINASFSGLLLTVIASILELVRGKDITVIRELFFTFILLFTVAAIFFSILVPLELKYGVEKSRVVMMVFFGIVFLGAMGIGFISEKWNIDVDSLLYSLENLSLTSTTIGMLIVSACIMGISCRISQNVMKNKNF